MNFALETKTEIGILRYLCCLTSWVEWRPLNCPVLRQYHEGRNRGAKCWNRRKNSNPFSPLGESTFPYSANFCDYSTIFAPRCKFFLREALRGQFSKFYQV
jgi:hypothetical protein